jgi:hypothetical protein
MGVLYFAIFAKKVAADGTYIARWTRKCEMRHVFHVSWAKIILDKVWERTVENTWTRCGGI